MNLNKSKIQGNNKAILSLSLILMLAMTLMMAFVQPSLAQMGIAQPEKTVGFATVAPTLIGVGQTLTCNLWVNPLPTTNNYLPYFRGFYGVIVTFVKPDGTKDSFMPTDGTGSYIPGQMQSLGALFFFYKPDMAGNWSISFTMPAQNITDSSGTVQYLGCTSNTFYFTVQTGIVLAGLLNGYPWAELPNANVYWSYPINSNNREWSQIIGDWTGMTNTIASVISPTACRWQPYSTGPSSAHIVWEQPLKPGGILGGAFGTLSYAAATNTVYYVNQLVIMEGKVFVNIPNTTPVGGVVGQFRCFDLTTGKVLYTANGSMTNGIHVAGNDFAQASAAQEGGVVVLANSYGQAYVNYLYGIQGTNRNYYDPFTGTLVRTIVNASTAQLVDGTELAFGQGTVTGQTGNYVYRWNMTSVVNNNWPTGITWKVPSPTLLQGGYPSIFTVGMHSDVVVVGSRQQYWGYSATTGAKLWNITIPYFVTSNEVFPLMNVDDFFVWDATASTWHCYSIATGAELWETPSVESSPWASTWTIYYAETNDLNNVYFATADGMVRAFSLTDGHLVWTSTAIPSTEFATNVLPTVTPGMVMVDGKIYVFAGYSLSYLLNPIPRFAALICINATTGDTLYTLNGGDVPGAAANGYLFASGVFDGNLYCLGKGQTSTTVAAPLTAVPSGTAMTIQGSVLDQSAAQPNTAAISDENMSVWMDYTHMQNSTLLNSPPNCIGVPVSLTAVDPNGNSVNIGTVTSDGAGHFATSWTPTTTGLYTIYATFAGSNSYFSSYGETSATVSAASTPTSSPAPTSTAQSSVSNSDMIMYFAISTIAIIIAIAVVGALMLRKK